MKNAGKAGSAQKLQHLRVKIEHRPIIFAGGNEPGRVGHAGGNEHNVAPPGSDLLLVGNVAHISAADDVQFIERMGMQFIREGFPVIEGNPVGKHQIFP